MADSTPKEFLDRVVDAGGVLLRVECLHPDGSNAVAILLTFDVGRLLFSARPEGRGLAAMSLQKPEDLPGGLEDAGENEPWWRLLGNAVCAVESPAQNAEIVRLQFRRAEGNPRFITLSATGAAVRVELEPA